MNKRIKVKKLLILTKKESCMSRNRKMKKNCMILLVIVIVIAAGFICITSWLNKPKNIQGGILVHEQHIIYSN